MTTNETNEPVVEPTITLEQRAAPAGIPGEERATAGRRWSARMFDLWLYAILLGFAGGFAGLIGDAGQPIPSKVWWILSAPIAMVVEAGVYAVFGTTFGRWVFCTRVLDGNGGTISSAVYCKRNLRLFLEGMAIGSPIVWIVAWLVQRQRVAHGKETTYDAALGLTVRQRRQSIFKQLVGIVFVIFVVWIGMKGKDAEKIQGYYSESASIEYLQRESKESPYACEALGLRYLNGLHVERNLPRAEKLFRSAARHGIDTSWWNLALAISGQPGREADVEKPLRMAAEKGVPQAQYAYGVLLSEDASRHDEAREWIRKAAAQGLVEAKTVLESWQ